MKRIPLALFLLLWNCVTIVECFSNHRLAVSHVGAPPNSVSSPQYKHSSRFAVVSSSDAADSNVTAAAFVPSIDNVQSVNTPIPTTTKTTTAWKRRIQRAMPSFREGGDALDREITSTALPSMVNLLVVPLVNSVDTFWVGRLKDPLALAGQGAANQAFFTLYFLVSFLPTITAPLVAKAVGSGNTKAAQARVCESLFLCNVLGMAGTLFLAVTPRTALSLVLPENAKPALEYAAPYLRFRALSMIPALASATGFAAYRGLLNTVTPLKVSLTTNAINLVLDPLFIFKAFGGMGFVGAALATAVAETTSGLIYLKLLLRRKLVRWSMIFKPPSFKALLPLLQGGAAVLFRQLALNVGFIAAGRRAQAMDPSGVSAAAYQVVMQLYTVGIVVHVAMQQTAAALVPSTLCQSGEGDARQVADRMFAWSSIIGVVLGTVQYLALPFLVPLFSPLPAVQEAAKTPAIISSIIHVINGPVFAGEGVMLGLGCYKDLALLTAGGIATMVACLLSPLGQQLNGILISLGAFCLIQSIGVVIYHLKFGPLAVNAEKPADVICDVPE